MAGADSKTVRSLDALMTLVWEFNDAVAPHVADLVVMQNLPLFLLAWLDVNGPKPLRDVEATLTALHADTAAVLDVLESRGLVAREMRADETGSADEHVLLTERGTTMIRGAAQAFDERLRAIGITVERIADLLET